MLKVYHYDIWDHDKGLIFAESREQACEIFRKEYDFPICPEDVDDYDADICVIDYVCDVTNEPRLVFTEGIGL